MAQPCPALFSCRADWPTGSSSIKSALELCGDTLINATGAGSGRDALDSSSGGGGWGGDALSIHWKCRCRCYEPH